MGPGSPALFFLGSETATDCTFPASRNAFGSKSRSYGLCLCRPALHLLTFREFGANTMRGFFAVAVLALSLSGCAKEWAERDHAECVSYGATGSAYTECRQYLSARRQALFRQGFNQIGDGVSGGRNRQQSINPPCIGCRTVIQNY